MKFLEELIQAREETKETWANRGYPDERQNDYALGGIFVLDQVIEKLTYVPQTGDSNETD